MHSSYATGHDIPSRRPAPRLGRPARSIPLASSAAFCPRSAAPAHHRSFLLAGRTCAARINGPLIECPQSRLSLTIKSLALRPRLRPLWPAGQPQSETFRARLQSTHFLENEVFIDLSLQRAASPPEPRAVRTGPCTRASSISPLARRCASLSGDFCLGSAHGRFGPDSTVHRSRRAAARRRLRQGLIRHLFTAMPARTILNWHFQFVVVHCPGGGFSDGDCS